MSSYVNNNSNSCSSDSGTNSSPTHGGSYDDSGGVHLRWLYNKCGTLPNPIHSHKYWVVDVDNMSSDGCLVTMLTDAEYNFHNFS